MSTTANMNLNLPTPEVTLGPEWATALNTALDLVDSHDHTSGKGVQVPTAGLNIDANLDFNENKATNLAAVQLQNLAAPDAGALNANSVQIVNGDLWAINGAGVAVQITSGSTVVVPSSSSTPAGSIQMYAGSSSPLGFLICDGSAVSRVSYAALFTAVGTTFGVGDGSTTFNLPDLRGRSPIGVGTYTDPVSGSLTRNLGQTLGAAAHVILEAELAAHNHGGGSHRHQSFADVSVGAGALSSNTQSPAKVLSGGSAADYTMATDGSTDATIGRTSASGTVINTQGSNTAHNNMQPSLGINFIIKT